MAKENYKNSDEFKYMIEKHKGRDYILDDISIQTSEVLYEKKGYKVIN